MNTSVVANINGPQCRNKVYSLTHSLAHVLTHGIIYHTTLFPTQWIVSECKLVLQLVPLSGTFPRSLFSRYSRFPYNEDLSCVYDLFK